MKIGTEFRYVRRRVLVGRDMFETVRVLQYRNTYTYKDANIGPLAITDWLDVPTVDETSELPPE